MRPAALGPLRLGRPRSDPPVSRGVGRPWPRRPTAPVLPPLNSSAQRTPSSSASPARNFRKARFLCGGCDRDSVRASRVYELWAGLTDRYELAPDEERRETEALMRRAASGWLAVNQDSVAPDTYLDRWTQPTWLALDRRLLRRRARKSGYDTDARRRRRPRAKSQRLAMVATTRHASPTLDTHVECPVAIIGTPTSRRPLRVIGTQIQRTKGENVVILSEEPPSYGRELTRSRTVYGSLADREGSYCIRLTGVTI